MLDDNRSIQIRNKNHQLDNYLGSGKFHEELKLKFKVFPLQITSKINV